MRLGIENHKGWRSAEQAAWLKRVSSEWVGVHFDFGNNISLCEEPAVTLKNLLPYTVACHIKDMAVQPYEEGFLLSEVPLGEGFLDIKGMVATLREEGSEDAVRSGNDHARSAQDSGVHRQILGHVRRYVQPAAGPRPGQNLSSWSTGTSRRAPLPRTTGMSPEAQLKLEDECIAKSIDYARANRRLNGRRLASRCSHHFDEDLASFLAGSHCRAES